MTRRRMLDLAPALAGLIVLIITLSISENLSFGSLFQKSKKLVSTEALSNPDREPITITNVKVGNKPINLNTEFDAEDDWIRGVSFAAKNRSHKNVSFVGMELYFPDPNEAGPGMVRQLRFGQRPGQSNATDGTLLLEPGQSIDVSLAPQFDSLKKFLEVGGPAGRFKKMMVRVYLVIFEDGTKWDLGNYYVPDPTMPTGFRRVESETKGGAR